MDTQQGCGRLKEPVDRVLQCQRGNCSVASRPAKQNAEKLVLGPSQDIVGLNLEETDQNVGQSVCGGLTSVHVKALMESAEGPAGLCQKEVRQSNFAPGPCVSRAAGHWPVFVKETTRALGSELTRYWTWECQVLQPLTVSEAEGPK